MIRTILEEPPALVSIALFVAMIAIWAGVLSSAVTAMANGHPRTCA
jgi:hypothetical protein